MPRRRPALPSPAADSGEYPSRPARPKRAPDPARPVGRGSPGVPHPHNRRPATPLGEAIHQLLLARGWTLARLGEEVGVGALAVSRWMSGFRAPSGAARKMLSRLGVNVI